ncbi:hypothetical protein F5X97DRAFT_320531 [Nemania serpens]|nr:hypothetical protein F5X97DRAFT_320531 [Nemania serpens]
MSQPQWLVRQLPYRHSAAVLFRDKELLHFVDLAIADPDDNGTRSGDSLVKAHLESSLEMQAVKSQAMGPSSMASNIYSKAREYGCSKLHTIRI